MRRLVLMAAALSAAACGSESPVGPSDGASLFPLSSGNRWVYRVRESNGSELEKIHSVTATAADGAFQLVTETGASRTVSLQGLEGARLVRFSEESSEVGVVNQRLRYNPPALRVDTQSSELGKSYDASFTEQHLDEAGNVTRENSKRQHFVIEAVDELLAVPAGEFRAVRVRRDTEGGASKTYWYVRGIGKIKEVGGQSEELKSFEVDTEEGTSP